MTAKQKETAEQRLLKMIEASSGAGVSTSNLATNSVKTKSVKKKTLVDIIRISNKFLLLVAAVILVLIFLEFQAGKKLMGQDYQVSQYSPDVKTLNEADLKATVQTLSYYQEKIESRNLFKPYEEEVAQSAKNNDEFSDASKITKKLKLVGVSWLNSVETATAMIENVEKKKTYFLKVGDKIEEDISVKKIYADSVDLAYENEEILLKYEKSQK